MIISWITPAVSLQIAQSTIYIHYATNIWEDIRKRLSNGDLFRISDILQEIHSMKQGERNISKFFTDFEDIMGGA